MDVQKSLHDAIGEWFGSNKMKVMPDGQFGESEGTASVSVVAHGAAAIVCYGWAEAGQPHDGVLLLTNGEDNGDVRAVWIDSWHQTSRWMDLEGTVDDDGVIRMEGSYPVDNRWRITVDPTDTDQLRMSMDNIMPDLEIDYHAVYAEYARKP